MNALIEDLGGRVTSTYIGATSVLSTHASGLVDVSEARERKLSWVWVFFAVLILVAAAVAFVWCVGRGYRGFSGNMRWHTKFKIPIGIDLGCY